MIKTTPTLVSIVQAQGNKGTTRSRTQFHNLIRKIDKQKQELAVWAETIPIYQRKVASEYEPLLQTYNSQRVELVRRLDRAFGQPQFKKRDREKLAQLILMIGGELIAQHDHEDLKPIYDKYSETDFDTEAAASEAEANEFLKSMMASVLGVDFDEDEDISSPEKLAQAATAKLQRLQDEQEERRSQARQRRAQRPKTARQLEKEAQQQAEARNVSKSIQDVYRKLVTAMHPDREPDPVERDRKTALMQQVNVAYEKRDLLQLLELQLALEQIDPTHLASLAEDRIKHYNKVLREQSAELEQELAGIRQQFAMQLNLGPFAQISPKRLLDVLNVDIAKIKQDIKMLRGDLEVFQDDAALKAWLKEYRIPRRRPRDDFLFDPTLSSFRF